MARMKIVTDSSADIPADLARDLDIEVMPHHIRIRGQLHRAGYDIGSDEVYRMLQEGGHEVVSVAPTSVAYEQLFRSLSLEYDYIFSLHLSNRLAEVHKAAQEANTRLPASQSRIELYDSRSASMGIGLVAVTAARAIHDGASPEEVQQLITDMLRHTHFVFFVDTLEHLERHGMLTFSQQVITSMQRIKPLLLVDDGDIVPYERTRTRAKAIEGLFTFVEDFPQVQDIFIMYSTTPDDIDKLLDKIELVFDRDRVQIGQFSPVMAARLGPGAMGVAVYEGIEENTAMLRLDD